MSKFEVKLNKAGVAELLKSSEVEQLVREKANQIKGACGDGYEVHTGQTSTRARAAVTTGSKEAYYDNLKNNTLLRARNGARG